MVPGGAYSIKLHNTYMLTPDKTSTAIVNSLGK